MPQSGLSIARHIRPTTMGVRSIGRISAPRTNQRPMQLLVEEQGESGAQDDLDDDGRPDHDVVLPAAFQKNGSLKMAT